MYKSRLYPPNKREARYRDNLPGLPDVIHIQSEIEANVSFLDKLSSAAEWNQPTLELGITSPPITEGRRRAWATNHARARSDNSSDWPTPVEASQLNVHDRNQTAFANKRYASEDLNSMGGTSIGTDEGKSTGSTYSLTHASKYSADARFSELEKSMQKKLDALDASGKKSSQRLLSIEQQFSRIDDLDKKLAAATDKLEIVTEHMEKSGEVQKPIWKK